MSAYDASRIVIDYSRMILQNVALLTDTVEVSFTIVIFYSTCRWTQCHKTVNSSNSKMFVRSKRVCPWQGFPA
jgi:hypothetical protein